MKLVQPIRNKHTVDIFGEELKKKNKKYYVMYRIGLTSGLRISDILNLKVSDIKKNYIQIIEKKTSKSKIFKLNSRTKALCIEFIEEKDSSGNLLTDIYGNITGLVGQFKMMIEDAAGKLVEVARKMIDVIFQSR